MKIAYVTNFFPPVQTGTAYYVLELAAEMAKRGHTVIVLTVSPRGEFVEEHVGEIHVYRLPSIRIPTSVLLMGFDEFYFTKNALIKGMVIDILRQNKIEVVHQCGHLLDLVFLTHSMAKKLGIPAVCSIHTLIHHPSSRLLNAVFSMLDRIIIGNFAVNKYDTVVGLDKPTYSYIRERYSAKDVALVPYGIDMGNLLERTDENDGDDMSEDDKSFRITSIGHVTEMRSREDLILACGDLIREGLDIRLNIIGKVCHTKPVWLVTKLGLEKNIKFCGEVPRSLLHRFLERADLEAHWISNPGLGTAILEAMAFGVTCMAFGSEGLLGDDIPLKNGENIIFIDPHVPSSIKEGIRLLYFNPCLKQKMSENARNLILNYLTWERLADKYEQLYREALVRSA